MIVDLCFARGVEVEVVGVDVSEVSEGWKSLFGYIVRAKILTLI